MTKAVTKNVQVRMFFWFGATLAVVAAFVGCGRDGYVVVKEAKTPHRAFDLPRFAEGARPEAEGVPLPVVPLTTPSLLPVPPVAPDLLPLRGHRAAAPKKGTGNFSVVYVDRTGDRSTSFAEGSVKDCAIFKTPGETAVQKAFLYAHLAEAARSLRIGLDMNLLDGKDLGLDFGRLSQPLSFATLSLRPVLYGRSFVDLVDSYVESETPPLWETEIALRQDKLDPACRASANVDRKDGVPTLNIDLSCGAIRGDANVQALNTLEVSVSCEARETLRAPFAPSTKDSNSGEKR